ILVKPMPTILYIRSTGCMLLWNLQLGWRLLAKYTNVLFTGQGMTAVGGHKHGHKHHQHRDYLRWA
ncbi:hypothetical protein MPER_09722, partial [Moniliophthora perniciosa FA553]